MIKIRSAGKDDIKDLQKLNNELFLDNYKFDPDLDLKWSYSESGNKYFSDCIENSDSYLLIAEDDGNPVGYLIAGEKEVEYRKGKSVFIENSKSHDQYKNVKINVHFNILWVILHFGFRLGHFLRPSKYHKPDTLKMSIFPS